MRAIMRLSGSVLGG